MGRELVQFSPLINRNDLHREIGYGRLLLCCNEESRGMASLNRGFDIGPLGNGCFISRISLVQLGLRCATQSSGKISRLRLLRRRGFHSTWTRPGIRKGEAGGGRGGGEWNYKCAMMSREYIFTRDIILPAVGRRKKNRFRADFATRRIHESYFRPWVTLSKDYHYEPLTRNI